MIFNALQEYVTFEAFYTLNKQCASQSSVASISGSSVFCDLDSIVKKHSYSCLTEKFGMSTTNILRALNRNVDETPIAPSTTVGIVHEKTTWYQPKLSKCDSEEENPNNVKDIYLRECLMSSGICLRDTGSYDESENNSNRNDYLDETAILTNAYINSEDYKNIKKEPEKHTEDPRDRNFTGIPDEEINTEVRNTEACIKISKNNKTYKFIDKKDKPTSMSGNGVSRRNENNSSCILVMEAEDLSKINQQSGLRNCINLVRVMTNKVSKIKLKHHKKPRAIKCPNCHEHIAFTLSTEDEVSMGANSKLFQKSETACTYVEASTGKIPKKMEYPRECPHGCEMVPICQIVPVSINKSNMKQKICKKKTPRLIRVTKACRHYPPCTAVPSCQRTHVLKDNCDSIPPCCHRPRCVNLPLCIPFCKNLQYDETTKKYVEHEESTESTHSPRIKCVPLSQYKLLEKHITHRVPHQPNVSESRAYYVNPTYLPCQVVTKTAKKGITATKSCQYDDVDSKFRINTPKSNANEESVLYIRDVGCQFKNAIFSPRSSYFQTRICYTSSASFDPASKRLDNIYINPNAVTCETLIINAKSNPEYTVSTQSPSSTGVDSLMPECRVFLRTRSGSKTSPLAAMLDYHDGGCLVSIKPKGNSSHRKYKNKFSLKRRPRQKSQDSQKLSNCCSKNH